MAIVAVASSIVFVRKHITAVVASASLITILYLPWLVIMRTALTEWTSSEPYQVGNVLADQIVRLGYWFVSLSFGETLSPFSIMLAAVMTPVLLCVLWRGIGSRPKWLGFTAAAAGVGFLGVSRWSGYPFTPSHVLFAFPFFLMLLVRGIDAGFRRGSVALAGIAVLTALPSGITDVRMFRVWVGNGRNNSTLAAR